MIRVRMSSIPVTLIETVQYTRFSLLISTNNSMFVKNAIDSQITDKCFFAILGAMATHTD